jgi:gliding motility-associated-like protein
MRVSLSILFFSLVTFFHAAAQKNSVNGRFSVADNKACAPYTVTVTAPQCTSSFSCSADFGNGTFVSFFDGDSFTYSAAGNYTIRIVFGTTGTDQLDMVITPNINPDFDIYSCGNNNVQVKVTDTNYDQYVIDFNDASPPVVVAKGSTAVASHAYGSSGNKTITVRGRNLNANDNCNANNKLVNAIATLPAPTINQLTVLNDKQIKLDFAAQPNILYKLEIAANNGTTFQQLQNVYNTNSITIGSLSTDNNYYCFRLGAFDPCNNTISYSNVICSSNFDVVAQNNNDKITWITATTGVSNFSLSKNPGSPFALSNTANSFNDPDIRCGTDYTYQLTSNYGNGSTSISLAKTVTAISTNTPSKIDNVSIVVNQNDVELSWVQDPAFTAQTYNISKSVNGSYGLAGTSTKPSYVDSPFNAQQTSCYKIDYADVCGNTSPLSNEVCPIVLTAALQKDNSISLNWSSFEGWLKGVDEYQIEKYNQAGDLLETIHAGISTAYLDDQKDFTTQVYVYRIVAYSKEAGLPVSVSNVVKIIKEPNLFYPSAFTPNGDGLNDTFMVVAQYTARYEMKIFNRWGEMLFLTTESGPAWDGTYKGNRMPEGTYVFTAKLVDMAGRTFERSGTVVLLKKDAK